VVSTAQTRYDISFFIAVDGGDAKTGTCYHDILPPALACDPANVVSGTGEGPFLSAECAANQLTDVCGDITQGVQYFYNLGYRSASPGPASAPKPITVLCVDTDVPPDGFVDVATGVGWDNQPSDGSANKPNCTGVAVAFPGGTSKCNLERTKITGLPVPTQSIEVRKILNPQADGGTFALQIDATTTRRAATSPAPARGPSRAALATRSASSPMTPPTTHSRCIPPTSRARKRSGPAPATRRRAAPRTPPAAS